MPQPNATAIAVCVPEYAPDTCILVRAELSAPDRRFVWCGRSLGWLPFETTSRALFHFFPSEQAAQEAAEKYVTLPVQE